MSSTNLLAARAYVWACEIGLIVTLTNMSAADNFVWDGSSSTLWETPANWTLVSGAGPAPPGVGDVAELNLPGPNTINFASFGLKTWSLDKVLVTGGEFTINGLGAAGVLGSPTELDLTSGVADLEINGGQLTIHDLAKLLTVTIGDDLLIRQGTLVLDGMVDVTAGQLFLGGGAFPGGAGTVLVDGGASLTVTSPTTTSIGLNGLTGLLNIQEGDVSIGGTLNLGISGAAGSRGTVLVNNDSFVDLGSLAIGGSNPAATGSMSVGGSSLVEQRGGSTIVLGGSAGAGLLEVLQDGHLKSGTGNITVNATGELRANGGVIEANGFISLQGGILRTAFDGEMRANAGLDVRTGAGTLALDGGMLRIAGGNALLPTSLNFGGHNSGLRPTIVVENGAEALVQFALRIGMDASTYGKVLVEGVNSGVRSTFRGTGGGGGADLIVGVSGEGELEVLDGGLATFRDDFIVADQPGSVGVATVGGVEQGFRATVDATSGGSGAAVLVGSAGTGALTISGGGLVQSGGDVFLAAAATSDATVTVGGADDGFEATLQSGDELFVGGNATTVGGTAELNVTPGGRIIVPRAMRLYSTGVVNLTGGTLDVGALAFFGGSSLNFVSGTVHFNDDARLGAGLRNEILGAGQAIGAGRRLSVANLLELADPLTLDGGELSIRLGANIDTQLNFVSGTLSLNDSQLTVGTGGLLGATVDVGANQTINNLGMTQIDGSGLVHVSGGQFNAHDVVSIASTGALINDATFEAWQDVIVQTGGLLENTGLLKVVGDSGVSSLKLAGQVDNQAEIQLTTGDLVVPAAGLTLIGGGRLNGSGQPGGLFQPNNNAFLRGEPGAVLNNVDNLIDSGSTRMLTIENLAIINGPTGEIGDRVLLQDVAVTGGVMSGNKVLARGSTFDGVVRVTGVLDVGTTQLLPTGTLRVESGGDLDIQSLSAQGVLRTEAGGKISVFPMPQLDLSNATVSLADDALHVVSSGVNITPGADFSFDSLTVGANPQGFIPAMYGAEPAVGSGQTLRVLGVATLSESLGLTGGTFRTGSLVNFDNLNLESGSFHLTASDFTIDGSDAGPAFSVPADVTFIVDQQINVSTGNRLIALGGDIEGNTLINSGDLDVIDGMASFSGAASNNGDINAIDATLAFDGGLTSAGQLNLINTTVNGPILLSGPTSVAGSEPSTFTGEVTGAGNFAGGGEVVFAGSYSPGNSAALVSFEGDVTLAESNVLVIELGGTTLGNEYDSLAIAGAAAIDGVLVVTTLGNYRPDAGEVFEFLTAAGGIGGQFSSIVLPSLDDGFLWDIDYGADSLTLSVTPAFAADFDADGDVDGDDLIQWRGDFGISNQSDADADGDSDGADLLIWQRQLGSGASTNVVAAVPEPTGASQVLSLVLAIFGRWQYSITRGPVSGKQPLR